MPESYNFLEVRKFREVRHKSIERRTARALSEICKDQQITQVHIEVGEGEIMGKQIDLKALLESKVGMELKQP